MPVLASHFGLLRVYIQFLRVYILLHFGLPRVYIQLLRVYILLLRVYIQIYESFQGLWSRARTDGSLPDLPCQGQCVGGGKKVAISPAWRIMRESILTK